MEGQEEDLGPTVYISFNAGMDEHSPKLSLPS